MRVLITGASGFLGSHVVRKLAAESAHEIALLLRRDGDPWRIAPLLPACTVISGTLDDMGAWRDHAWRFAPDTVIHLAWEGVGNRTRDDAGQVRNIERTVALVQLSRDLGVRAWVGLGSQAEYGPMGGPASEETPTRPQTLYGIAKLSAGWCAARLCRGSGLRYAWLRLFSAYGERDDPAWLLPSVILALLDGRKPALTEGTQRWDYLHAEDAAGAIAAVAASTNAEGVFNLGSGRSRTIREIVEMTRDRIDPRLPLGFGERAARPDQSTHLEAEIRRLREATGWSPRIALEDGLERTIAWFRKHRDRHAQGIAD